MQLERVVRKPNLVQKLSEKPGFSILQNRENSPFKDIHRPAHAEMNLKPFLANFGTSMRAIYCFV